jgi:hypothetical protein
MRLRTPTPAMVVACLALALSLGGTGYAVASLPRQSVGTPQLKSNAVVSAKVKNGSLTAADFAQGQLPAGPQGPAGSAGQSGPPGSQGTPGPKGDSGVLQSALATGGGPNPSSTLAFFGKPATVDVPSANARVLVVSTNGFGAGSSGGQLNQLNLAICHQAEGASAPVKAGGTSGSILGLSLPANTRVPMGMSYILQVPAGKYQVGLCGTGGPGWTNNDWGTTTALVFNQ